MGFCGKCGVKLPDDARFCGECGAALDGVSSSGTAVSDESSARVTKRPRVWRTVWITLLVLLLLIGGCIAAVVIVARRHGISVEIARPSEVARPEPVRDMPSPAPQPSSATVISSPSAALSTVPETDVAPPASFPVVTTPAEPMSASAAAVPPELAEANKLCAAGRYADALSLLDRFVLAHPDSRAAQFRRGTARLWLNDLAGAGKDFSALAESDGSDVDSRRSLAFVELATGEQKVARRQIESLAAAHPGDPKITLLQAQAALYDQDTEAARRLFAEARRLNPASPTHLLAEGVQFGKAGVMRLALLEFNSVLWLDPTEHQARYDIALAYEQLGQRDQAIRAFEDYLHYMQSGKWADIARQHLQYLKQAVR